VVKRLLSASASTTDADATYAVLAM